MMKKHDALGEELQDHIATLQQTVLENKGIIIEIEDRILACFQRGNKLLFCGNGGSAADSQHFAAEFVNRFRSTRPALPAIALTTDSSILTCISNDSSFDHIFSRQVDALAQAGDILVGISTSGGSLNVLNALEAARTKGATTIGFTSQAGLAKMQVKCDLCVPVPSTDTARIQEAHEFIWHVICGVVEEKYFRNTGST
jgi:D-sedoheptulose 7-phosphate isomerase